MMSFDLMSFTLSDPRCIKAMFAGSSWEMKEFCMLKLNDSSF